MRLIDADAIQWTANGCGHPYCKDICEYTKEDGECCGWLVAHKREVDKMPTVDAVPVNELLKLRDWLYESDGITMGGLRSLNALIATYLTGPLPKIENGFERRNDD